MEMERTQLSERVRGKMRHALSVPVGGETRENLDRIGAEDRRLAQQGLVELMREDGEVYHLHIDRLDRGNRPDRIRAERATVAWLKGRLEKHRGAPG